MTIMDRNEQRVHLDPTGPNVLWKRIFKEYVKRNTRRLKLAAILALREECGWSLEHLGELFDCNKGHILRVLDQIKQELQPLFERSKYWDPDDTNPDKPRSMESEGRDFNEQRQIKKTVSNPIDRSESPPPRSI